MHNQVGPQGWLPGDNEVHALYVHSAKKLMK